MNRKEIAELRKRLKPEKNNISRIYGCFVNSAGEIVSRMDEAFVGMTAEEEESYLGFLRKTLSGTADKNLIGVEFTTEQVMRGPEHRLLQRLRNSGLEDREAREEFFETVRGSLEFGDVSYLVLLASETWDIPKRSRNDEEDMEGSDSVFRYILCAVCPVRDGQAVLKYEPDRNEFHSGSSGRVVTAPELGFLFPAFDDRQTNIYGALYYSRSDTEIHTELMEAVFGTKPPLSAAEQKEAFETALTGTLEQSCSYEVVRKVNEQLADRLEEHKESKNPEPLRVSVASVGSILRSSGVEDAKVEAFQAECRERFGDGAELKPAVIINTKRFEVKTPEVKITVSPEYSYLVETRLVDGKRMIVIPADEGVTVNGVEVAVL